ncbi:hypothetical protein BEP19_01965 [Ammoniphilus oxalaticus]|uniref:DUF2487 domain-containing protein n=1 Tax=Ammoniphilus oxalaticus TaxID=66863 RepID=A0A419SNB2_9BACL|nr:DUF2487 family protein [Ammoniphilus oxalaticus]RKD25732.1 hypothetical protein BEP19_01965 [Ammoniphilus oxalaticus]
MRWTAEDIEKFEAEKEFIDTALIPIFSFSVEQIGVDVVKEQKWLEEICVYTERQLTGRVLLFPTLYALDPEWRYDLLISEPFRYQQCVTTNPLLAEKLEEQGLSVYLLGRAEDEEDLATMVKEGKKLTNLIMERWKNKSAQT